MALSGSGAFGAPERTFDRPWLQGEVEPIPSNRSLGDQVAPRGEGVAAIIKVKRRVVHTGNAPFCWPAYVIDDRFHDMRRDVEPFIITVTMLRRRSWSVQPSRGE